MKMKIIADENIPFVGAAFQTLGQLTTVAGRQMTAELVREADILLVRSVTPVNQKLLAGSQIKFVGTATIGTDHIDLDYLTQQGIGFSNAAGSNANSVAEYVIAALVAHAVRQRISLKNKVLGVVGVGNIGRRVVRYAEKLGWHVLQNDPPLARQTGEARFVSLDDLMDADFITLHVPLTFEGQDKTYHLFDAARLHQMKPDSVLINTSRGPVVETQAAKQILESGYLQTMFLDVWENEPEIDLDLLTQIAIGTPHIAGYSLDGKVNGTKMIYDAACHFFQMSPTWEITAVLPPLDESDLVVIPEGKSDEAVLHEIIQQAYSIEQDDANLRKILTLPTTQRNSYFDQSRKNYPIRREFNNYTVHSKISSPSLIEKIKALGFQLNRADY